LTQSCSGGYTPTTNEQGQVYRDVIDYTIDMVSTKDTMTTK